MIKRNWITKFKKNIVAFYREGKNDWNTLQSILTEDEYGLSLLCPNPQTVVDIGGHIGGFSLLAASQGASNIKVVEILPENVSIIKGSAELNNFKSIHVIQKAISNISNQEITAYYMDTSNTNGDHHEFVGNTMQSTGGTGISVLTISLDDLLSDLNHVDILKVDCEGAEWPMLEGASKNTLDKIDLIVGEIHGYQDKTISDMRTLLKDFEDISNQINGNGKHLDIIAFRKKK
jgi:FkbM family methyltransferase